MEARIALEGAGRETNRQSPPYGHRGRAAAWNSQTARPQQFRRVEGQDQIAFDDVAVSQGVERRSRAQGGRVSRADGRDGGRQRSAGDRRGRAGYANRAGGRCRSEALVDAGSQERLAVQRGAGRRRVRCGRGRRRGGRRPENRSGGRPAPAAHVSQAKLAQSPPEEGSSISLRAACGQLRSEGIDQLALAGCDRVRLRVLSLPVGPAPRRWRRQSQQAATRQPSSVHDLSSVSPARADTR